MLAGIGRSDRARCAPVVTGSAERLGHDTQVVFVHRVCERIQSALFCLAMAVEGIDEVCQARIKANPVEHLGCRGGSADIQTKSFMLVPAPGKPGIHVGASPDKAWEAHGLLCSHVGFKAPREFRETRFRIRPIPLVNCGVRLHKPCME